MRAHERPAPIDTPLHPGKATRLEATAKEHGATGDRFLVEHLMVPMRDGVRLATMVIRPRAAEPVPVVMERTPYTAELHYPVYKQVFEAGWAVVVQNERGSLWSEGTFSFLGRASEDAADTLEWVAAQPWSNGQIGLIGCSSPAENQLRVAAIGHPALKACVAMSSGAGVGNVPGNEGSNGAFYRGGVPMLADWALWYAPFGVLERPKLPSYEDEEATARALRSFEISSPDFRSDEYTKELAKQVLKAPSGEVLRRLGAPATEFEEYLHATPADSVWRRPHLISSEHTGATPSLNINGWMDIGAFETVKLFEFQQNHSDQYLIMAPTSHCRMTTQASKQAWLGDRPVGDSSFEYDKLFMAWFKRLLAGDPADWEKDFKDHPRVKVFLMGAGTWLTGDRWPLAETRWSTLYLRSESGANTLWGDGVLSREPAAVTAGASSDTLLADPQNPVPSHGGGLAVGALPVCTDQRPVECRQDVLVFSTPVLEEGIAVAGDVEAELFISVDVPDTDIHLKLVDVYPDGCAYNLADTSARLRYRDGYGEPAPAEPGAVYRVRLRGITTANWFGPGHRLRIEVAGSNFPSYDRNWNQFADNELQTSGPVANVTLYHDEERPSRIEFREYFGKWDQQPRPDEAVDQEATPAAAR